MAKHPLDATYRLHVSLDHIEPPIWRRILVRSGQTLHGLHEILQLAMGWTNSHIYLFEQGDVSYGEPDPDWSIGEDSHRTAIEAVLRNEGDSLDYTYDMGDGWRHTVLLESVLRDPDVDADGHTGASAGVAAPLPRCEAGERACPPEDCGGPFGYVRMLEALADPEHDEHEDMRDWIGEFDPEPFSIDLVNRLLCRYAGSPRGRAGTTARPSEPRLRFVLHSEGDDGDDDGPATVVDYIVHEMYDVLFEDPIFEPAIRERAVELLVIYDALVPGALDRSLKLSTWAAGAIHGAFVTLPGAAAQPALVAQLADMFGVSVGSVYQKSQALRSVLRQALKQYP